MGVVMRSGAVQNAKIGEKKALTVMRSGAEEVEMPAIEEVVKDEKKAPEAVVDVFICEECGQETRSNAGLAAHVRSHK